jgi:intracellular sulfur oxidation DsrE/DsrF family protein
MISRRNMLAAASAALPLLAEARAQAAEAGANPALAADELQFPMIEGYGGIYPIEGIAEQPFDDMKVLFDLTTEAKPGELNKGLEIVARFLNLAGAAGIARDRVGVEVVIHGPTVISSLKQDVYVAKTGENVVNPNAKLIGVLAKAGVPLWICSQAVRRQKFALTDILPEIKPAASAMTVSVLRQQAGWAVLLPH